MITKTISVLALASIISMGALALALLPTQAQGSLINTTRSNIKSAHAEINNYPSGGSPTLEAGHGHASITYPSNPT
jgi:hypothetical protein